MVIPGVGNVSLSDCVFLLLWALVIFSPPQARAAIPREQRKLSLLITCAAFAVCSLSAAGNAVFAIDSEPLREFAVQAKQFGLPSIVPFAVALFADRSWPKHMLAVACICLLAMLLFVLFPELTSVLPVAATSATEPLRTPTSLQRATGLVSDPNDCAFIAVALAAIISSLLGRPRMGLFRFLPSAVALIAAAACVVASGSRSGLIGGGTAIIFVATRNSVSIARRLLIVTTCASIVYLGLQFSGVFQDRVTRAYVEGTREENVASRWEAQEAVLSLAFDNPLGIGHLNLSRATRQLRSFVFFTEVTTSDSVYLDTLVSAGFAGLLALAAVFLFAWRYVRQDAGSPDIAAQAGIIGFLVFGFATVTPISVFTSPFFFFLPGITGCRRLDVPA